jgi:hypothetical protein
MSKLSEILQHIGKRPGMYFGGGDNRRSIHLLSASIVGYQSALDFPDHSLPFSHFTRWVAAHYRVIDGAKDGFTLILEHAGGDESLAFDEFFRLLPAYARDMAELGPDAVQALYEEVQAQFPVDT